jgi:hypothetical protein
MLRFQPDSFFTAEKGEQRVCAEENLCVTAFPHVLCG